jgi:hypothetical protein
MQPETLVLDELTTFLRSIRATQLTTLTCKSSRG